MLKINAILKLVGFIFVVSGTSAVSTISANAEQNLRDTCIVRSLPRNRTDGTGYIANSNLVYYAERDAKRRIEYKPGDSHLSRYYEPSDRELHSKEVARFAKMVESQTKAAKILGVHVYPRPYFQVDDGRRKCQEGRTKIIPNEHPFYPEISSPRIVGDLCQAEPHIVGDFNSIPKRVQNTVHLLRQRNRGGFDTIAEIIYSPMFEGMAITPQKFVTNFRSDSLVLKVQAGFQKFVQELSYLTLTQCGRFPKRIKLEGRALAFEKNAFEGYQTLSDGSLPIFTGYLNFQDEGISLSNVTFSAYGQKLVEHHKDVVEKLIKQKERERVRREWAASQPVSPLMRYWRQAGKKTHFTLEEVMIGLANLGPSGSFKVCNQGSKSLRISFISLVPSSNPRVFIEGYYKAHPGGCAVIGKSVNPLMVYGLSIEQQSKNGDYAPFLGSIQNPSPKAIPHRFKAICIPKTTGRFVRNEVGMISQNACREGDRQLPIMANIRVGHTHFTLNVK